MTMSGIYTYILRKGSGAWAGKRGRPFFSGILAVLSLLVIPSCYSSHAVMGTPVKDLILAGDQKVDTNGVTKTDRGALTRMGSVKENRTFTEIEGIPEYRIGPLDVLKITTYIGDKATVTEVTVNSRGKISYSFLDDVLVTGLAPSQVDALLSEKLASYVRRPRINVLVKEFKSKDAMLTGEFSSLRATNLAGQAGSGRMYLQGKTRLMDLIAQAGGYTVNADIKKVKLIRGGRAYLINLYDIIEKGDETLNVVIDDKDVINIPELPKLGERVYVMGEVNSQGIYALKDAQDLLAAISLAGSFTRLAKEENTLIVRGHKPGGTEPLVMMADLKALLRKADIAQNIRLEDGDLVYVPRMVIGDVNDWIANTMPLLNFLLYPYDFQSRYFKRRQLTID
jgi:protein involved in polysaccharide export with SLBB domain